MSKEVKALLRGRCPTMDKATLSAVAHALHKKGCLKEADVLAALGEIRTPSVADLFVAMLGGVEQKPSSAKEAA